MTICNVANSSIERESDFAIMTQAGREIGVASTKAFTTQPFYSDTARLVLARRNGLSNGEEEKSCCGSLKLPHILEQTLTLDNQTADISLISPTSDTLYSWDAAFSIPLLKKAPLKLKEISYIHAEAYPAGELKHGPLALVDDNMPVIAVAPNDELLEKNGNLEPAGGQCARRSAICIC